MRSLCLSSTAIALGALLSGCADESFHHYPGGQIPETPTSAALAVRIAGPTSARAGDRRYANMDAGQNTSTELYGLKYYIKSILICESLETQGTAFHNPDGCLELYRGNPDPNFEYTDPSQDFVAQADLARQDDVGFVDLATAEGRTALERTIELGPEDARRYRWGIVTWYLPIKVTAEVPVGGDLMLRTHDGPTSSYSMGGGYAYLTTAPGSFSDGRAAEEAVIMHPNGGSWFRFQNALEVTSADIDARTQFELDLTFNPDGLIKGYTAQSEAFNLRDSAGDCMAVPMLDLTPVAHEAGKQVMVETYRASVVGVSASLDVPEDDFDVRLELYSIEGDPTATIYGATLATLVNDATTSFVMQAPKVSFMATANDNTLTFQDWAGGAIVSGFARHDTVGDGSLAAIHCGDTGGFRYAGCGDGTASPSSQLVRFTLESIHALP
jgi:hypothetical protein